jgi:hypothetical protein
VSGFFFALLLAAQADAGFVEPAQTSRAPGPDEQRVRITVRAIAASNEPGGFDEKLAAIAPHLQNFREQFRYRSYKLLQEKSFDLDWKTPAEIELPGSRSLQVMPRQLAADGKIRVHLELLGEHPAHSRKLHTDYTIQRGGTLLVGGLRVDPKDEKSGTLLIAVTQAVEK